MPEPTLTPATVAIAALLGVVGIVALGVATDNMRAAVVLMALFAAGGAVARVVLPVTRAFAVRRRAVDVSVLLVLAAALAFLGLTTPLG